MTPERVEQMREELLDKEEALNSVQDFLLGQDDDLCACLDRVGNLESTILASAGGQPNTGARRIGYADDLGHGSHIMAQSNAPMLSPPTRQAPLWSVGSRDVAAAGRAANDIGGASKRSTAVQRTLEPCLTPAPCSSLPPRPMLQNSQNMIPCPHRSSRRDIAAPDGHDMRENCSNSRPMNVKQTHGVNTPPARSNDEQGYTADAADRVDRAERRAEEAEEARQVAEAATAAAESEAQRAHDQTQCLRFEAEEMARWRDALLQVRETLESAEHARHTECHNAIAELHKNGAELGRNEDPGPRHTQGTSPPAPGALLPSLQHNARDPLSDLPAAHCREYSVSDASTKTATSRKTASNSPSDHGDNHCDYSRYSNSATETKEALLVKYNDKEQVGPDRRRCSCCRCCRCEGCEFIKRESRDRDKQHSWEEGVPIRGANEVGARAGVEYAVLDCESGGLRSLSKECETLRIVVQTLRQKDEESQARISALEEDVFQKSLAAVKREAIVLSLRKQQRNPRRHIDEVSNAVEGIDKTGIPSSSCAYEDRKYVSTPRVVNLPECELSGTPGRSDNGRSGQEVVESTPPFLDSNATRKYIATRIANSCCNCSALPLNSHVPACMMRQPHQGRPAAAFASGSAHIGSPVAAADSTTRSKCREIPGAHSYVQSATAPFSCSPGDPIALSSTPTSICDRRSRTSAKMSGDGSLSHRGRDNTPDGRKGESNMKERHPLRARTPTTDILRRLLYESTPTARDGNDARDDAVRRSTPEAWRNPMNGGFRRRLFGGNEDGHGAMISTPPQKNTDSNVEGRAHRGSAVVQIDGSGRKIEHDVGGGVSSTHNDEPIIVNEIRNEEAVRDRKPPLNKGQTEHAAACEADFEYVTEKDGASGTRDRMLGFAGGQETSTKVPMVPKNDQDLRERLLQARRNFSALTRDNSMDEL